MRRCLRCVIPDTRPDTAFVDGICSACIAYEKRPTIDWAARKEALLALIERARRLAKARGSAYDVIVPSSGGKDSHYQVLTLIELGARPLVVTASTCYLTHIGRANLENLKRYATTIEVSANRAARAKLNRIGFTQVGDISWPEHVSIFTTPFRVARATGIPFLFYGENPQNQYGGPMDALESQLMTRRWVSEFGGFLGLRPDDLVDVDGLTAADMADYLLPDGSALGVEAHFLGQYLPWDSHQNAERAISAGFAYALPCQANWWKHENLDNAQTGLHDHAMYRKYGYGRFAAQISVDVRSGRVDRARALELVEERDGLFPYTYADVGFLNVIAAIGMTEAEMWHTLDKFTNWALFRSYGKDEFVGSRPALAA